MRVPFQRRKPDATPAAAIDPEEVRARVPASVRHPEANRFTPLGSDFEGDDGSDEDIEFLTALVNAVDRPDAALGPAPARPAPPPARKPPVQRLLGEGAEAAPPAPRDHMALFREAQMDLHEQRGPRLRVDDVDLGDLLEELETTAAALRRRRAA